MLFRFLSTINAHAKETIHNVNCGRHSGFKPCCILWFTTGWKLFDDNKKLEYMKFARGTYSGKGHPGYIPCPRCALTEDFVKVAKCACGDKVFEKYGKTRKSWDRVSWIFVIKELVWNDETRQRKK